MNRWLAYSVASLVIGILGSGAVTAQHAHDGQGVGDYSDRGIHLTQLRSDAVAKTPVSIFGSEIVDQPFTGAIARLMTDDPTTSVWVRVLSASGATEWMPAEILGGPESPIRLAAINSDDVFISAQIEFAVSGGNVQVLEAGVFDSRDDDDAKVVTWDIAQTSKGSAFGKIIPPYLISRVEWDADPFRGEPIPLARPSYEQITFHHAACCGAYSYEDGIDQVSGIQTFHQDGRGWSDIGYHFLMDQSGRLYQGRPFLSEGITLDDTPILVQGAHVGGHNVGNIGVSALGCYHPPESNACVDVLSAAAFDSLITVLAYLSERYDISPSSIMGHRDFSSTACPGDNNYRLLPEIRRSVAELLATGNAPVGVASLSATSDADGVVQLVWQFQRDDGIVRYRIEREIGSHLSVIFASDVAEDFVIVDSRIPSVGPVSYRLTARNADGRWATLATAEVDVVQPDGFQLSQSFPNPSSTFSTARYFVAQDGIVNISLFDALGRRERVLIDEYHGKNEWRTVLLPLQGLAAGQYYYRMQVYGFSGVVFEDSRGLTVTR